MPRQSERKKMIGAIHSGCTRANTTDVNAIAAHVGQTIASGGGFSGGASRTGADGYCNTGTPGGGKAPGTPGRGEADAGGGRFTAPGDNGAGFGSGATGGYGTTGG